VFETEKALTALKVGWWQETRLKGVKEKGKLVFVPSLLSTNRGRSLRWTKTRKGFWFRPLGGTSFCFCLCHSYSTEMNQLCFNLVLSDLQWNALRKVFAQNKHQTLQNMKHFTVDHVLSSTVNHFCSVMLYVFAFVLVWLYMI